MKVRFFDIAWDVSDNGFDDEVELDLPTEIVINDVFNDTDLELEGADILSNEVGFCVLSFEFEILG